MEFAQKQTTSNYRFIVFFVAELSPLEKNLSTSLVVEISIEGYMLTLSTVDIVTLSLFISNFSSLSFGSDTCTMVICE